MQERSTTRPVPGSAPQQHHHAQGTAANDQSVAQGLDDVLDEIDNLLEENAEEFVRNYVQKGGQ